MVSEVRALEKLGGNDLRLTFETVCEFLEYQKEAELLRELCLGWIGGELSAEDFAERAARALHIERQCGSGIA